MKSGFIPKPIKPSVARRIEDWAYCSGSFGRSALNQLSASWIDLRTLSNSFKGWRHRRENWPYAINIEPTNICNADCVFCAYRHQGKWRSGKGIMSSSLFDRVVQEHASRGGKVINLAPIVGEPLIDPNIVTRCEYVLQNNMQVWFYTNGTLLVRTDLEALLKSGIRSIGLSTSALREDIFNKVYRNSHYADLIRGLQNLLETRNRLGSVFTLQIGFRSNLSFRDTVAMSDFQKLIRPLLTEEEIGGIEVVNRFDTWGGQIREDDLLSGMVKRQPPRLKRRPCLMTFQPHISWEGIVRMCGCRFMGNEVTYGDPLVVGDLRDSSLSDIYHSRHVEKLQESFLEGSPPSVCTSCTIYRPV